MYKLYEFIIYIKYNKNLVPFEVIFNLSKEGNWKIIIIIIFLFKH